MHRIKAYARNRNISSIAIAEDGLLLDDEASGSELLIPLTSYGVISYLDSRQPTQEEINGNVISRYTWANSEVVWNPNL